MGTYSFNISCPRCGYPAYVEGHSLLPEESLSCRFCGYSFGSKVDREKLVEGQPPPEPEKYENKSAGAYYIRNKRGGGEWGHLEGKDNGPVDWEEIIKQFQEIFRDPDVDLEESYLTKWDDENNKLIHLIGHPKIIIFDECPEDCPEECFEKYGKKGPEQCPRFYDM